MRADKKRKWIIWAVLLAALCVLALFRGDTGRQLRTELIFRLEQEWFEETAASMLAFSSYRNVPGVHSINLWPCQSRPGERVVQFSMGGWGFGPATGYVGMYTTTDGKPADFQGADVILKPEGDGYTWQEEKGDNTYYTEEVLPGWFYYRATF